MFQNQAARRGTAIAAAALSAVLVAPSLTPVATAAASEAANSASATTTVKVPNVDFSKVVVVEPGKAVRLDLSEVEALRALGADISTNILNGANELKGAVKLDENKNLVLNVKGDATQQITLEFVGKDGKKVTLLVRPQATATSAATTTTTTPAATTTTTTPAATTTTTTSKESTSPTATSTTTTTQFLGSSDLPEKCTNALIGFGVPILALIPLSFLTQYAFGSTAYLRDQIGTQIQNFNTEVQRQAGIYNPELATQVEAANNVLKQVGLNVGSATLGLAAVGLAVGAGATLLKTCGKAEATSTLYPAATLGSSIKGGKTTVTSAPAKPTTSATKATETKVTETKATSEKATTSAETKTETSATTVVETTTEPTASNK